MPGINKAMIVGRLGNDPDIRRTQGGDPIANLSIATSETWRDKNSGEKRERTDWHRVSIFGKAAEIAEKYLHKGSLVGIEGKLQTRKWQDKNGTDHYSTEIVVSQFKGEIYLLGNKSDGNGGGGHGSGGQGQSQSSQSGQSDGGRYGGNDMDDDIPFAAEWR